MTGWMTVEVHPLSASALYGAQGAALVVPAAGCRLVAYPSTWRARSGGCVDEHFAVDADRCRRTGWLRCADVLYGSRCRSWDEASAWLARVTAAFGACGLAACTLGGGGWAVQSGIGRRPIYIAAGCGRAAVASCLHGWMVAGGSLDQLGVDPRPVRQQAAFTVGAGRDQDSRRRG